MAAKLREHRNVIHIAFAEHRVHAAVTEHLILLHRHQKARGRIINLLRQAFFAPRFRKAKLFKLRKARNVLRRHRNNLHKRSLKTKMLLKRLQFLADLVAAFAVGI